MTETNWYVPTTDEIKASATRLGGWRPEVFELWLAGQTYILESEDGTSLKASGWVKEADVVGRQWTHTDGKPRRTDQPNDNKTRWAKQLTPARPTV